MLVVLVICIFIAVAAAATALIERRRIVALRTLLAQKEEVVDRNAKLLISKNIELFDQNLAQQRQWYAREDFIAIVSHQLRTPLTEIKWGLTGLFDEDGSYTPPDRAYAERIRASATHMERLIDTLLRFVSSEVEYGAVPAPFDADEAIRAAIESSAAQFPIRKLKLDIHLQCGAAIATLDRDALALIIGNLVDNAFYYTPDGGTITVASNCLPANILEVSVTDTGMGIPESEKSAVFSRFNRSTAAQRVNAEGAGLGLYITKRILERCGGTIDFTSSEGKGSTFRLTLPLVQQKTSQSNSSHV
jgi:signal transduction histidine kinase